MNVSALKKVIVVGGGAAGQMAAIIAAAMGAEVTLIEKMPQTGLKMGITGKGRCNLTNTAPIGEFIRNTPGNGKFLYSAYRRFSNRDLMDLLNRWGMKLKEERGGRVFPVSDSAQEVRAIFLKILQNHNVRICCEEIAEKIKIDSYVVTGVHTNKNTYPADAVILTTGGASYPQTGSDGSGYQLAADLGHTITDLRPSLIPLLCEEKYCKEMQGLSLRNVELTLFIDGKKKTTERGEMLFTHFGLSGPLVLTLSDAVSAALEKKRAVHILLNSKPALTEKQLDNRIQRDLKKYRLKQMGNALQDLLPQKMILPILNTAAINHEKKAAELTKEERRKLLLSIRALRFTINGTRPLQEAIVTAGGIEVREVNPQTMESKLIKNLFFAGEVLDIHAYTGGFNLQAAFSTGYIAGMYAGREDT